MLQLTFTPESKEFVSATKEYQDIWATEREDILKAFEAVTGLRFQQKAIDVVVYEGPSFSGKRNTPMKLRASYSREVKQATLVHELGHRLIAPLHNRPGGIDEHRLLNLFLFDVWTHLYGEEHANDMIEVESKRKGTYDYEAAWNWFLERSAEEKARLWREFVSMNAE